jgi:hypothetical protein
MQVSSQCCARTGERAASERTACANHAGCTAPEIMAVSGHSTLAQVQIYIDEVEGDRMADAAMQKLGAIKGTRSG